MRKKFVRPSNAPIRMGEGWGFFKKQYVFNTRQGNQIHISTILFNMYGLW